MANRSYAYSIKSISCTLHRFLTQPVPSENDIKRKLLLKENVHVANFNHLNRYVLNAFEISLNMIGHNPVTYSWKPIGCDRKNIDEVIDLSTKFYDPLDSTVSEANSTFMFTPMVNTEERLKHHYGTRIYLIRRELKHHRDKVADKNTVNYTRPSSLGSATMLKLMVTATERRISMTTRTNARLKDRYYQQRIQAVGKNVVEFMTMEHRWHRTYSHEWKYYLFHHDAEEWKSVSKSRLDLKNYSWKILYLFRNISMAYVHNRYGVIEPRLDNIKFLSNLAKIE